MYIWLVLSTFLAILAGYSLPLRSDTSDKVDVPVATASAMRMVVTHKVALNYLRTQKWPFKCTSCAEGAECSECDITHQTAFGPGLIDFTSEGVNSGIFEPDENYKSLVLCYNQDGTLSDKCFKEESNNRSR